MGEEPGAPLPAHLVSLRRKSFTVFVSNLSPGISKPELEAMQMFCRSGRIVDSFLRVDQATSKKKRVWLCAFQTRKEANKAVADGNG